MGWQARVHEGGKNGDSRHEYLVRFVLEQPGGGGRQEHSALVVTLSRRIRSAADLQVLATLIREKHAAGDASGVPLVGVAPNVIVLGYQELGA